MLQNIKSFFFIVLSHFLNRDDLRVANSVTLTPKMYVYRHLGVPVTMLSELSHSASVPPQPLRQHFAGLPDVLWVVGADIYTLHACDAVHNICGCAPHLDFLPCSRTLNLLHKLLFFSNKMITHWTIRFSAWFERLRL